MLPLVDADDEDDEGDFGADVVDDGDKEDEGDEDEEVSPDGMPGNTLHTSSNTLGVRVIRTLTHVQMAAWFILCMYSAYLN